MAAHRVSKKDVSEIGAEYGLPRVTGMRELGEAVPPDRYLLETAKGRYALALVEPRSEMDGKREIDLLQFLRKHGFPCQVPLADRRGRYAREWYGQAMVLCRYVDGHPVEVENLSHAQLEDVGRVIGDLHVITKAYKKGIDNRFALERLTDVYNDVRGRLPYYLKRIVRTLDEEVEYLTDYLESKLPKGIIHGELAPEHLRFKGDKVVAVLEIGVACRGKFIFDLANAVNALCYEGGRYHLKRFEALLTGYEAVRTLSLAEWDAFPNELRFSAFRCAVLRLRDFFETPADDRQRVNRDFQEFYERLRILRREREGGMEPILMAMATGYDYRRYQRVKAVEKRGH